MGSVGDGLVLEIGELVRVRRQAARLTQQGLAGRAGISVGALRDLEQGRTRRPRWSLVSRLAEVLDLTAYPVEVPVAGAADGDGSSGTAGPGEPGAGLWLRVLGPIHAWRDGTPLALGPPRQRAVLGLLALNAGITVHRDALVDALWGHHPPAAAVNEVQACVGRLRAVLDPDRPPRDPRGLLVSGGTSYRLQLAVHELDWLAFGDLVERAAAAASAGQRAASAGLYERAMALCQGLPLADVDALRRHPTVTGALRMWAAAVADFTDVAVGSGLVERVLPELWRWVERDPLNEKAHALLMTALAEAGQPAAALSVFADIRARLDAQLGLRPGRDLSAARRRILRHENPPTGRSTGSTETLWVVPRQLPATVRHFVGREDELTALTRAADAAGAAKGSVPIAVISGAAGVGKSALALHWAHQNAHEFPDGHIYINLRGFDPAGPPLSPAAAIRSIVDALGVPADHIPPDPPAQSALYRSLVAGRRVLIVLDNARDAEQARGLLPGSAGPVVVITSRNELTSMVAIDGAKPVRLSLLDANQSRRLIAGHLGVGPVTNQPEAVDELIALCGRLPLALSIVAARAATRPDFSLSALVTQLRDARRRLDVLSLGEAATDLRAVFSSSYVQLDTPAARMFRFLGTHPGPDISTRAAASLAGVAPDAAAPLLEQLTRDHLLTEVRPQRWEMHDLLRAYAVEQITVHDGGDGRPEAIRRLLDHYLHTAHAAARLFEPSCEPLTLGAPAAGVTPEEVTDDAGARKWFAAEHRALLNAIAQAAETGHEAHAWQLAWTIVTWCTRRGLWADLATAQQIGLEAARRTEDRSAQANAHIFLARAGAALGHHDEAEAHLHQALALFGQLGDSRGRSAVHLGFTVELDRRNHHVPALDHALRFLELARATGQSLGEAVGLNNVGWCYARLGDHAEALAWCEQALKLSQEHGYRATEARTWDSLGYAYHHLGRFTEAADCYHHALVLYEQLDDQHERAETLDRLGDTQSAAGDPAAAQSSWRRAADFLERIHPPGAQEIRDKIRRFDTVHGGYEGQLS